MGEMRTCPACFERVDSVRDRWTLVRLGGAPLRKRCPSCLARVELQYVGWSRAAAAALRRFCGLEPASGSRVRRVAGFVGVVLVVSLLVWLAVDLVRLNLVLFVVLPASLTLAVFLLGRVEVAPAADESPAEYLVTSLRDVTDDRRAW